MEEQVGSGARFAQAGEPVTIITRDAERGSDLKAAGAHIAVVDIHDVAGLREVFCTGKRSFLLNPPIAPSGDTDSEERANVVAIVKTLDGSGLEKIVAAST